MTEDGDELELQALQRRLDDAFATTRPRRGFEDELWSRVQQSRPATSRFRDAFGSWRAGLRSLRVPAAAVAAIVIVGLSVGILLQAGGHPGGGASSTTALNGGARAPQDYANAGFGKLPSGGVVGKATSGEGSASAPMQASSSMRYVWTGTMAPGVATAPVYRYREPSQSAADQFATGLGAVLRDRPAGFLGSYSAATYTLKVRGTVQSPPSSPAYFIFSSAGMPAVDTAGVGYDGAAANFLAGHGLAPDWPYGVTFNTAGDPVKVVFQRQFVVAGYGPAYLVNSDGDRYGLEVDFSGNRPVLASGLLPMSLDTAQYDLVSPVQALAPVLGSPATTGAPVATLTHGELVYVLVPAGDHSFYEPAYLFTGTMQSQGKAVDVRLLTPAVDPSQRSA